MAGDWDPMKISKANKAKVQAKEAFAAQKYDIAIGRYKYLLDILKIKDEKAQLNLAHAYMRKAEYDNASTAYTELTKVIEPKIRSVAFQQLGILQSEKKNKEKALKQFKNALKSDTSNAQARYNYELLMKHKEKEIPKSQDKKNRDDQQKKNEEQKKKDEQQKKDQEKKNGDNGDKKEEPNKDGQKDNKNGKDDLKSKDKKDDKGKEGQDKKDGDKGDKKEDSDKGKKPFEDKKEGQGDKGKEEKPSEKGDKKDETEKPSEKGDQKKRADSEVATANKEQLQKMNISEQQAKAILNAMKQGETQYIQQMKRTSSKPQQKSNKKDW